MRILSGPVDVRVPKDDVLDAMDLLVVREILLRAEFRDAVRGERSGRVRFVGGEDVLVLPEVAERFSKTSSTRVLRITWEA